MGRNVEQQSNRMTQPVDAVAASDLRVCPTCASDRATELAEFRRDDWRIVRCDGCDLVYLSNPPGYAALAEDFAWEKTYLAEDRARLAARPISHRIDLATRWRHKIGRKPDAVRYAQWFGGGNLLDVGCAGGSRQFPGFTLFGIEISDELARIADDNLRRQGGYCVQGPGAEAIREFSDAMFDGVILRSYLEHEENPRAVLNHVRRVLKPTGRVFVRVPNFGSVGRRLFGRKWVGFRYPDHVNYFTLATLRDLAAQTGFMVRLLNPVRLPLDDNINVLFEPVAA